MGAHLLGKFLVGLGRDVTPRDAVRPAARSTGTGWPCPAAGTHSRRAQFARRRLNRTPVPRAAGKPTCLSISPASQQFIEPRREGFRLVREDLRQELYDTMIDTHAPPIIDRSNRAEWYV